MKVNANRIVRDDPWEDELEGCRFVACMAEDEGNLPNIQPQADKIREDTWKNILKLREYFDKQLGDKYKHRRGKSEIMRAFQAKRLYESVLTLFLGGYDGMKRPQDLLIRDCEKRYRYVVLQLHSTLTTAPRDKDDHILPYEDIAHNYH